ncbi:hypothetical protein H3C66_00170 [Patescibacteria group bacterium]|nr:hypothetical protein [Patescibacteria group bacterium]
MKKLAAFFLAFFLFAVSVQPALAQDRGLTATQQQTQVNENYKSGNTSIGGVTNEIVKVAATVLGPCQLTDDDCGDSSGGPSASRSIINAFTYLYTPPADTQTYIADVMNSAGLNIAQPAYAQGLGFSSLDPVLDTWKAFRNVAYLFYVIMFLVIGFMIMFRQKISSQAVVSAQQALPKIIVSLIAVTFSYAIAGLLIDAMYIVMYLIVGLFPAATFGNPGSEQSLKDIAMDRNIFQIGTYLLTSAGTLQNAQESVRAMIRSAFDTQLSGVGDALGLIGGLTFAVVFALATLFGIFRLFFELLKTYISIIISIVLSPLALMLGALPGNNAFQAWIKTLVANLAVFPGILLILVLAFMLIGGQYGGRPTTQQVVPQVQAQDTFFQGSYNGGFLPPYIPGAGSGNAISIMLGLGVILIMPDLAASIKKTLGGSGGIFEQFANNFTTNLEKGWKGGELVPGLGFTNTNNYGVSGRNIASKLWRGTKESRERAEKGQPNVIGRGIVGESAELYKRVRRQQMEEYMRNKVPRVKLGKTESEAKDRQVRMGGPPKTQVPPSSGRIDGE